MVRRRAGFVPLPEERNRVLNAIAGKLKRHTKQDFKGHHFEARPIIQAVGTVTLTDLQQKCR